MKKLWQKGTDSLKLVDEYCFSEGVVLDNNIVEEDVLGSIAHAHALQKLGIITSEELISLTNTLKEIVSLYTDGKFIVSQGDEDIHTKVENYLTEKLGDLGKKIHTARSRNDQVALDMRLYTKKKLIETALKINELANEFNIYAQKYEYTPMPGYTHMQKAMPSSIGLWANSFAESLLDDLQNVNNVFSLNDQSPLGSGAAYGISLPIDRELTSNMLGFQKVQNNSLYSQVSRPKIQLLATQALVQIMLTLSRFASDILLFTTSEFNFFNIDLKLCTGSSIMPQKKNVDIMEYLRAKTKVVMGFEQILANTISDLPSGYNADFSESKGYFIKSFEITQKSLQIVQLLLRSMEPNVLVLEKAMTSELFATHAAYELVKTGIPFRDAYVTIGKNLNTISKYNVKDVLMQSSHIGGTGNLGLKSLEKILNENKNEWIQKKSKLEQVINTLLK
ncbi:MAG: argininosuccinate lyase [bacterium]|nr:argininosuccinate lyase [bacterium]